MEYDAETWRSLLERGVEEGDHVKILGSLNRESVSVVKAIEDGMATVVTDGECAQMDLKKLYPVWRCDTCEVYVRLGFVCAQGHLPFKVEGNIAPLAEEGSYEDRCIGVVLGGFVGDALGAPVEGWPQSLIAKQFGEQLVSNLCPGTHMGVREQGFRYGMYTDDTNSALALLSALVLCEKEVDAQRIALSYVNFYCNNDSPRGYPSSAQAVMKAVESGHDIRSTGRTVFADGSFANGGCMRIGPLCLRVHVDCTYDRHYEMAALCVVSSHVHEEAVESTALLSHCCHQLLHRKVTPATLLEHCLSKAQNASLVKRLLHVHRQLPHKESDMAILSPITDVDFQLKAVDAFVTALYFFVRYVDDDSPERALMRVVSFGGDCDTTAAMLGYLIGAHCGTSWIPRRWYCLLENNKWGRDYAVSQARLCAKLPKWK